MKELIVKNLKPILLIAAIIMGVLLIYISDSGTAGHEKEIEGAYSELELYGDTLEKKLERIVEEIEGAGNATVMITFESSFEKVYANNARVEESMTDADASKGKTTEKQIVLAGAGTSGESPVLLKELCPRVEGVVVVCSGTKEMDIERKIKDAAVSLFGISELKVYVAKSGDGQE